MPGGRGGGEERIRQSSWGVQGCLETGDPTNIPGESETYPKKPQTQITNPPTKV